MGPHYAEAAFIKTILLLFSYLNSHMKKSRMLLIYHDIYIRIQDIYRIEI